MLYHMLWIIISLAIFSLLIGSYQGRRDMKIKDYLLQINQFLNLKLVNPRFLWRGYQLKGRREGFDIYIFTDMPRPTYVQTRLIIQIILPKKAPQFHIYSSSRLEFPRSQIVLKDSLLAKMLIIRTQERRKTKVFLNKPPVNQALKEIVDYLIYGEIVTWNKRLRFEMYLNTLDSSADKGFFQEIIILLLKLAKQI